MKLWIYLGIVLLDSIVFCVSQKAVPCVVNPFIGDHHNIITCYVEDVDITEQDNFMLLDKDKNGVTIGNLSIDKIQQVEIMRSQVKKFPKQIFDEFVNIERFYCRGDVEIMLPGVFERAHKLVQLNFNENKMSQLEPYNFKGAETLLDVRLGSNLIENVDEFAFDGLDKLVNLRLAENKINHLHENTFKSNIALERIDLTENKLEILPSKLFLHNLKLKKIELASNQIRLLANTMFSHLNKLTSVDFDDNACIDKGYDFDDSDEAEVVFTRMENDLLQCVEKQ